MSSNNVIKINNQIVFENGKLNTTENMTPARRYSYLVGENEPCHTAISRFYRFIIDDPNATQPTLDDLEDSFSVEKVTDEYDIKQSLRLCHGKAALNEEMNNLKHVTSSQDINIRMWCT